MLYWPYFSLNQIAVCSGLFIINMYQLNRIKYEIIRILNNKITTDQPMSNTIINKNLSKSIQCNTEDDEYIHVKYYNPMKCNIFDGMKARDIKYDKKITYLDENILASDAITCLYEDKNTYGVILSKQKDIVGILDTTDVIRYMLNPFSDKFSVKGILRQCVCTCGNTSLIEIITYLKEGIRYICIKNETDVEIVSQGSIVRLIEEIDNKQDILSTSVEKLGLGKLRVISTQNNNTARSAFETMVAYGVTSLPVLDSNNKAIGVISASDIFYARTQNNLELLVLDYVKQSRTDANISREATCIVSCSKTDKLYVVLKQMLHEKIHHVYVLEDDEAIGVISFVDILSVL